jgi:hypothetical protein
MKKTILSFAALICVSLLTISAVGDLQSTCDSPIVGGHTGAPGSPNCTYCHPGTSNTGPGSASFTLGNGISQYQPGKTYDATVMVSQPNLSKYGFVITARDNNNSSIGDFVVLDSANTRKFLDGKEKYFSHTPCGADASPKGSRQWNFKWTAPSFNAGPVKFYVSTLASNHDETTKGDDCYTITKTLGVNTGVSEPTSSIADIKVFPNPFSMRTTIQFNLNKGHLVDVAVYNIMGQKVITVVDNYLSPGEHLFQWDAADDKGNAAPAGVYFFKLSYTNQSTVVSCILSR